MFTVAFRCMPWISYVHIAICIRLHLFYVVESRPMDLAIHSYHAKIDSFKYLTSKYEKGCYKVETTGINYIVYVVLGQSTY